MIRTHSVVRSVLLAVLLAAAVAPAGSAAPDPTVQSELHATLAIAWQLEVVDGSADVGRFASLILDVEDRPHISYYDGADHAVRVAYYDGSAWQIATLDSGNTAACPTSLALDLAGRTHVSYCGTDPTGAAQLKYAHHDGTGWKIATVSGEAASHTTLALDSGGQPHIGYRVPGALRYASYDGSTWTFDTVDSSGDVGAYASLAIDGSDRPHLSYYDAALADLKYAYHDGSAWQVEPVAGSSGAGGYNSLALNAAGQPHIGYYGSGHLQYAWHDGSAWHGETVDGGASAGWYASLALDPAGQPRIAYYQSVPGGAAALGQLKYAHLEGADWEIEIVDSAGDVGGHATLGLDAAGWPHIGYRDATSGHLKHAAYDLDPPQITRGPTVDPVTSDSALVSWGTDEDSTSLVRYGRLAGVLDLQQQDAGLAQTHAVPLTGLEPATTYHFVVQSADASGNTVTSQEGFFTTAPLPDGEPPGLSALGLHRSEGPFEYFSLAASASDNVGVERVEFSMDGKLLGTAYSPAAGGAYEFLLAPFHLGMARDDFYSEHNFAAVAYDAATLSFQSSFADIPLGAPLNGQLRILSPDPFHTLYAPGGTTPPGTSVNIQVYASEYKWECWMGPLLPAAAAAAATFTPSEANLTLDQVPLSQWPPWCHDVERAVEWVQFYVDGVLKTTSLPVSDTHLVHTYTWGAAGLGPGSHQIGVVAGLSDGSEGQRQRVVQIVQTDPHLDVNREIVRIDNYFRIRLLVENLGTAAANVERIVDNLTGFQAIQKPYDAIGSTDDYYTVVTSYLTATRRCDVTLGLHGHAGGPLPLGPGQSVILEYLAVPILYPNPWAGQYMAGEEAILVSYRDATGPVNLALDRPGTHTFNYWPLETAVYDARAASDYLIVTNPSRLFIQNELPAAAVNRLLSAMAELARFKTGILGDATYVPVPIDPFPSYPCYDAVYVRFLLDEWGSGMKGSDGVPEHHAQNGYVLLVGEDNIVPAVNQGKSDWVVRLSDLWYGDTNGDWPNPERVVGRIAGDTAEELAIPIETSIRVERGDLGFEFGRNQALVIAGRGDGRWWFEQNADDVADKLWEEFNHVMAFEQDEQEDAGLVMRDVFRQYAPDRDVIYYRDHAGTGSWGDGNTVVDTDDLVGSTPIDFGDTKPFVFGCACLSGNYSGLSLAEAFLRDGAGIYIGATEVSNRWWNNKACKRFYEKWVNHPSSIGQALRDTKRDITGGDAWSNYEGDRWAAEYNLYGDPKYGAASGLTAAAAAVQAPGSAPPASLSVEVPGYIVTAGEEYDTVEIPGGNTRFEVGRPLVPIYVVETAIPEGYRVQDLVLTDRSGLTAGTGLNLATAALEWDPAGTTPTAAEAGAGWWPEEVYDWQIRENTGGGSTLVVHLAPFYYDPVTTDFKFYSHYEFTVESAATAVAIELLATDHDVYPQGDEVLANLWLDNAGEAQDVLVEAAIKSERTGQVVAGLPLRTLHSLQGLATYSIPWDSTGCEPGRYTVEVKVRDSSGTELDRALAAFTLGISHLEITAFTASPALFDPGDPVAISLQFENLGTLPISGTARIEVQDRTGGTVATFDHPVAGLAAGGSLGFDDLWATAGVPGGPYRITGQVFYAATATEPRGIDVRARTHLHLPCIRRAWP